MLTQSLILLSSVLLLTTPAAHAGPKNPKNNCSTFLTEKTVAFPSEKSPFMTIKETETKYSFERIGKSVEEFQKDKFQASVHSFIQNWVHENVSTAANLGSITVEFWLRDSAASPQKISPAIIVKTEVGNFMIAPIQLDPDTWSTQKTTVLVDPNFPRFLGFFPRKVNLSLEQPLGTPENVALFKEELTKLGVTEFNYGNWGTPEEKYAIQVFVPAGSEAKLIKAIEENQILKKFIASAQQAYGGSFPSTNTQRIFSFEFHQNRPVTTPDLAHVDLKDYWRDSNDGFISIHPDLVKKTSMANSDPVRLLIHYEAGNFQNRFLTKVQTEFPGYPNLPMLELRKAAARLLAIKTETRKETIQEILNTLASTGITLNVKNLIVPALTSIFIIETDIASVVALYKMSPRPSAIRGLIVEPL